MQLRAIINAIRPPAPAPVDQSEAADPYEPWTFYDPKRQSEVTAYLDPQNQLRHVPLGQIPDVPKTWRRVLLAPPGAPGR